MNLCLDSEPEWLIANIVEYVASVLCGAIVGLTLTICVVLW